MSNLSDIKRRLTSVKQTRQITGAMETVSIAKMRKSLERLEGNRAYTQAIETLMRDIYECVKTDEEVCCPKNGKDLVIVLSSDRGLCGGFDHEIFLKADSVTGKDTVIMPIGNTAYEKYKKHGDIITEFVGSCVSNYSTAEKIGSFISNRYGTGFKSVSVVYAKMVSQTSSAVVVKKLLPLDEEETTKKETNFSVYDGTEIDVYHALLPLYINDEIYSALINNITAEHCARRAAMSSATESADGLINALSVEYNRARQSSVTEQIVEIIGSTGAIKMIGVTDAIKKNGSYYEKRS